MGHTRERGATEEPKAVLWAAIVGSIESGRRQLSSLAVEVDSRPQPLRENVVC